MSTLTNRERFLAGEKFSVKNETKLYRYNEYAPGCSCIDDEYGEYFSSLLKPIGQKSIKTYTVFFEKLVKSTITFSAMKFL